jgi:hypothetical protein
MALLVATPTFVLKSLAVATSLFIVVEVVPLSKNKRPLWRGDGARVGVASNNEPVVGFEAFMRWLF